MLDTSSAASAINTKYQNELRPLPFNGDTYLLGIIANVLDSGFQQATKSNPNIDISPPAGSLQFDLIGVSIDNYSYAYEIGNKCALYWSKTITPTGSPVSCGSISSVTNDAMKIAPIIAQGLIGLGGSKVPVEPYYYNFVNVIYSAVKTIVWTVSESDGSGCSATITTTVS